MHWNNVVYNNNKLTGLSSKSRVAIGLYQYDVPRGIMLSSFCANGEKTFFFFDATTKRE